MTFEVEITTHASQAFLGVSESLKRYRAALVERYGEEVVAEMERRYVNLVLYGATIARADAE